MSTHNICFRGEIRKNIMWLPPLICSYEGVPIYYEFTISIFSGMSLILMRPQNICFPVEIMHSSR